MWRGLLSGNLHVPEVVTETTTTTTTTTTIPERPKLEPDASGATFIPPKLPPTPRANFNSSQANNNNNTPAKDNNKQEPAIAAVDPAILGTCRDLVEIAKSGGMAVLMVIDPPGHGHKMDTLDQVLPAMVNGVFSGLPVNHTVNACALEICGAQCRDVMDHTTCGPSTVRIVERADGAVTYVNAMSKSCPTPEDLLDSLLNAKGRFQKKQPDDKQPTKDACFSRHFLCRIVITPSPDAPTWLRQGKLFLVHSCLAATAAVATTTTTTMHYSTKYAGIDKNVEALIQCLRARSSSTTTATAATTASNHHQQALFYQSTLTRCLRECLESEGVTCHVLDHAKLLENQDITTVDSSLQDTTNIKTSGSENVPLPPKRWNHDNLCDWLVSRHLVSDRDTVPKEINGRIIMKMTKPELLQHAFCNHDAKKADLIYKCLRAETDRVARLEVKRRMALNRSTNNPTTMDEGM